jgi:hypothetical protein
MRLSLGKKNIMKYVLLIIAVAFALMIFGQSARAEMAPKTLSCRINYFSINNDNKKTDHESRSISLPLKKLDNDNEDAGGGFWAQPDMIKVGGNLFPNRFGVYLAANQDNKLFNHHDNISITIVDTKTQASTRNYNYFQNSPWTLTQDSDQASATYGLNIENPENGITTTVTVDCGLN